MTPDQLCQPDLANDVKLAAKAILQTNTDEAKKVPNMNKYWQRPLEITRIYNSI